MMILVLLSLLLNQCVSMGAYNEAPASFEISHDLSVDVRSNEIHLQPIYSDDITKTDGYIKAKKAADELDVRNVNTTPSIFMRITGDLRQVDFRGRSSTSEYFENSSYTARAAVSPFSNLIITLPNNVTTENPLENQFYRNKLVDNQPNIRSTNLQISYNSKTIYRKMSWRPRYSLYMSRFSRDMPQSNLEIRFWQADDILSSIYFKSLGFEIRDYESAMPIEGAEVIINALYINGENISVAEILQATTEGSPYLYIYNNLISSNSANSLFRNNARANSNGQLTIRVPKVFDQEIEITADILVRSSGYERFEGKVNLNNNNYIVSLPAIGTRIDVRTKDVLTPAIRGN